MNIKAVAVIFRVNFNLVPPIRNGLAFHTSSIFNGQAKIMKKIIGGSKKKKYFRTDTPTLPSTANIFGKTSFESKVTGNPRRSSVLNKLFMRHITDLMATGEYSSQLVGHGIEVNKVQITLDYKILKVYWIANKYDDLQAIENILIKNAGFLRHELSQLRVMGEVPNIVFVKDKNYSKIAEVEKKLALADFGEDYQGTDLAEKLKSGYEIWSSLDSTVKEQLQRLDLESAENDEEELFDIPAMPQNVLGLDHSDILNRLRNRLTTSEALHRKDPTEEGDWSKWNEFKITQPVNSNPVSYSNQQEQRQAFKDFLQHRQVLKMKERKTDKNWTPDMELLKEEMRERHLKSIKFADLEPQYHDEDVLDDFEISNEDIK